MENIIIFGTGALAKLLYYYLKEDKKYKVAAFTNDTGFANESWIDKPLIKFSDIESKYPPNKYSMFIAVGYTNRNSNRSRIYEMAKLKGYNLVSYIHPTAVISDNVSIGDNCFIFENVVMQPYTQLGNGVIIQAQSYIGHHSRIHDYCFISPCVAVAGFVTIKPLCFIGLNSSVRDRITIEKNCIIGMGSVITKDTLADSKHNLHVE